MTTDHWTAVGEVFHRALELSSGERTEFVRGACGSDAELLREVESLLAHHERPAEFLAEDAIGGALLAESGTAAERTDPWVGARLGAYRTDDTIAAGGMGVVYRASRQDGLLQQQVAIKVMHPWRSSHELVRRFQMEWQTLADLAHPNVAQVIDAGLADDGTPYLVMEYIEGVAVDRYCDERGLGLHERLELFETIARAVHFAHQNLVVHRDLKPANILVTSSGVPKLLDFGIAKILRSEIHGDEAPRTVTRAQMMTPEYASPEQARGEPVTTATDIYSLGVLLYELLSGRRPFEADTAGSPVEQLLADRDPPKPSTAVGLPTTAPAHTTPSDVIARRRRSTAGRLRKELRGDLDNVVMMAMHKDASRRYASAERFADDVRRYLAGLPVAARADTLAYRVGKFVARNRLATAAGVLAGVAVAGGTLATAWQARLAALERDHATIEAGSAQEVVEILSEAISTAASLRTPEQLERARQLLERHVFRVRREYAERPHERANLIDALGHVHLQLDLFEDAEALIDEAAAIRERAFGRDSMEFARSLSARGDLAYRRGDHESAAVAYRAALLLHRAGPPGVHTDVPRAANDLAVVLRHTGHVDEAERLHREALALRRAARGDRHPLVAASLNNLSGIHAQRGDYAAAEACLTEALAIRREVLGERHPMVAQTLNNLSGMVFRLGRRDDAKRHMQDAVDIYREIPGGELEATARALTNLATLQRILGELEPALAAVREALELHRRRLGDVDHPYIADTLQSLADIHHKLRHADDAKAAYANALAMRRRLFGDRHEVVGESLCNYGAALVTMGEPEAAEPLLREALEILSAVQPTPHHFLAGVENGLGNCMFELERYGEAEPFYLAAYERLRDREEAEHAKMRQSLAQLYRAWGKPAQAAEFEEK